MTDPVVPSTETVEIDTPEISEVETNEVKGDGANDPNESFADWQARQAKSTGSDDKETSKETKEEVKKEEPVKAGTVKVGDKEYGEPEITELLAQSGKFDNLFTEVQDFIAQLRTDPSDIFDKVGVSQKAIEDYYYNKYIEPTTLTAEQKLERYEKRDQEAKEVAAKEQKAKDEQSQIDHYRSQISKQIEDAITEIKLPSNSWVNKRMAEYIKQGLSKGVTAQDAAQMVKNDLIEAQKMTLSGLDSDKLAETLGEDVVSKLRSHEASKFKSKFENTNPGKGKIQERSKKDETRKKVSNIYDLLD